MEMEGASVCVLECVYLCVSGVGHRWQRPGSSEVWMATHSALSPSQKEAFASKMRLRVNSEGTSYRVLAVGMEWGGRSSPWESVACGKIPHPRFWSLGTSWASRQVWVQIPAPHQLLVTMGVSSFWSSVPTCIQLSPVTLIMRANLYLTPTMARTLIDFLCIISSDIREQSNEVGTGVIPISKMKKLRHSKVFNWPKFINSRTGISTQAFQFTGFIS